eukprot:10229920-Ditylum_brightwellii.AAC.1
MNHLNYNVDYKNTVFEKPELTHVHGEPTMANLLTLRNEIQANAQAVSTTLGGGRHGHLGLLMTPQDYALIPNTTAYIRPPQPLLILPQNGTQYQITQAKE